MRFYENHIEGDSKGIRLKRTNWDDWYKFETQYWVVYVHNHGEQYPIGHTKIGHRGMQGASREEGPAGRIPPIPASFESLNCGFFSLGQNEEYYLNLQKIEDDLQLPGFRISFLKAINDIAYNIDLFETVRQEEVALSSLMREVSEPMIRGQFHRIASGGARLTEYHFGFALPTSCEQEASNEGQRNLLKFNVIPESIPPTNINAVIGRNGVGKTRLIKSMLETAFSNDTDEASIKGCYVDPLNSCKQLNALELFSNVICIGFSAFDDLPRSLGDSEIGARYTFIGLDDHSFEQAIGERDASVSDCSSLAESDPTKRRIRALTLSFKNIILSIVSDEYKLKLWNEAIELLKYDNYFKASKIDEFVDGLSNDEATESSKSLESAFSRLSSGHKIVLLTVTSLVNAVVEKSLVILDEPETHLHPPLLSTLIRAISHILIHKNGVALIMTHSAVVLQEIPSSCAWEMQRCGEAVSLHQIKQRTFGSDINSLMREVFGLEIMSTGFHRLIESQVNEHHGDFEEALDEFNGELGNEGIALLKALSVYHAKGRQDEEDC